MNFTDLLGSVMGQGMTPSSNQRIDNTLNQGGGLDDLLNSLGGGGSSAGGGLGDLLNSLGGGGNSAGGGLLDSLGKMAGAAMNSGSGGGSNPMVTGGLGALVGALLGGGKSSAKGALGGTALALLGNLALKALQGKMGGPAPDSSTQQLMAGLRPPENEQEAREVQSLAELTVKAMLNAAKADQLVDKEELRRIIGKASEDSLTWEEQEFITREMEKPMDTAGLIRAVPNQQVAAQVYAASLLAIEVDTDAERDYLRELASGLGLDSAVTDQLHSALGVA